MSGNYESFVIIFNVSEAYSLNIKNSKSQTIKYVSKFVPMGAIRFIKSDIFDFDFDESDK